MGFNRLLIIGCAILTVGVCVADDPPISATHALETLRAEQAARAEMLQKASASVVCIFADPSLSGGGSGVLISPLGYGLTNFHVVQEMLESRRGLGGLNDGRLYPLKVLGVDPGGDIALFRLEGREEFPFAPLGDSDDLQIGERVTAIGNPFLVAEDFTPSISFGVVSGLRRYQAGQDNLLEYADCIQVSSSINPGNSGGPLFDRFGRVVGINGRGSFEERGRVNVGLGYAVTVNQIKRFLPALLAGRLCLHGTLGATVRELDDKLIIDAIQGLSPAEVGGLELGDEPLRIAQRSLKTANDFSSILATLPADWPVAVRFRHATTEREATVRLEPVSLRLPIVFLPEASENTALVRILVRAFSRSIGIADELPAAPVELEVAAAVGAQGHEEPKSGRFRIEADGGLNLLSADVASPTASQPGNPVPDESWAREAAAALSCLSPGAADELAVVGGDEVDGRVVIVLERQCIDGARTRWLFDLYSLGLRGFSIGKAGPEAPITWDLKPAAPPGDSGSELIFRRRGSVQQPTAATLSIRSPLPALPPVRRILDEPVARGLEKRDSVTIGGPFATAIEAAQARVVKISGRGIGRALAYGSGIVVSADGLIVTGLSSLLESPALKIVLPNGRRTDGKVVARDEHRQLALLKCEANDLPFFEMGGSETLQPGDWVVSASNAFKVAEGPELVSISAGVFSGRTTLAARRRSQEFSYDGEVLLTDIVVSTPGSEGGALVDRQGRLQGMLGKALKSKRTNTWVSFALPVEQIAAFLEASRGANSQSSPDPTSTAAALLNVRRPAPETGIRLFDIGASQRPPFVERVRAGSPAAIAGLMPNDLLLSIAGEHVANCDEVRAMFTKLQPGQRLELNVKRGNEVKTLTMILNGGEP